MTTGRYPYYCMTAMSRNLTSSQDSDAAHSWYRFLKGKGIPAALTVEKAAGFGKLHNVWCVGEEVGGERPNGVSIQGHKIVKSCNGFDRFLQ